MVADVPVVPPSLVRTVVAPVLTRTLEARRLPRSGRRRGHRKGVLVRTRPPDHKHGIFAEREQLLAKVTQLHLDRREQERWQVAIGRDALQVALSCNQQKTASARQG